MQHVHPLLLAPVFPAMVLHMVVNLVTIPVFGSPGGGTNSIGVKPWVEGARVLDIQLVNLHIQPVNLLLLIHVVGWLRPVVVEPSQLWGVHQRGYSHGVGDIRVVLLGKIKHQVGEAPQAVQHPVPGVPLD